jgi:hypothetical protein
MTEAMSVRKEEATSENGLAPTLIGREDILAIIREQVLHLTQSKAVSLVILTSESGYGKSRLLQYLLEDDNFSGARESVHVFWSSGTMEYCPIPLTPWKSIITVCFTC